MRKKAAAAAGSRPVHILSCYEKATFSQVHHGS
jgi:hypothetical protein